MDAAQAPAAEEPAPKLGTVDVVETEGVSTFAEAAPGRGEEDALNSSSGDESEEEWETESLYEDALQVLEDEDLRTGGRSVCLWASGFYQ